ncbi:MAG: MFS transporter [Chloroflexi bacterium]|nr:MFS transporter [Chloroflexota bacterium]
MNKSDLIKSPGLYGWVILAVAFVIMVVGYAVRNTFSVFYPAIVDEFGWSRGNTAIMFSISIIVYGVVAPVAGNLMDRFGPRLVFPIGATVMGAGLALCSLARTQWQFYLLYGVIVAAGLSIIGWTPCIALVSKWFVNRSGMAFGILAAGFGASLVSASIGQFLISNFGWRTSYVVIGVFAAGLIMPLAIIFMRNSPQEDRPLPDAASEIANEHQAVTVGADGFNDFATKWRATDWTLVKALRTYRFWLLFFISFSALGIGEQIAITHQVYFYKDVGFTPMTAAVIYSVFGIAFVIGGIASILSDRLGRENVFVAGCLLGVAAVSLLFFIKDMSQPWLPFLSAFGFGLGLGVVGPVLGAVGADLFQGKSFGLIYGAITIGFSMGGAISPWLAGFIHDRTGSYFTTYCVMLVAMLIAAVFMVLVAPRKIRRTRG